MNINEILTPLALGLASTMHCALMCGPILVTIGGRNSGSQFLYQAGRFSSYIIMGAILGSAALALDKAFPWKYAWKISTFVSIGLFLFTAISLLLKKHPKLPFLNKIHIELTRLSRQTENQGLKAGILGIATGFFPCSALYPAYMLSISEGSPEKGAIFMGLFWLGTLPLLLGGTILLENSKKFVSEKVFQTVLILLFSLSIYTVYTRGVIAFEEKSSGAHRCHDTNVGKQDSIPHRSP